MRAVTSSQGQISVIDVEEPSGQGELITVSSSGICGSDLHLIANGLSGIILGHEFGGYTSTGELVAVRPTGECGTCHQCKRGVPNTCAQASASLHGTSINGGLAEKVLVDPSRLFPVPDGTDPAAVGLVEPLAVVIHGINRIQLVPGQRVLVVGAGSIGLLCAAALLDRHIEVDILTRHPHQTKAAEALGATPVSQPGRHYDASFDAVCTQESFDTCISATRPRGDLVEFGVFWGPISIGNSLLMKEITLYPSIFYSHDHAHNDFAEAIDLLHRVPGIATHLVIHRFHLEDAKEAFRVANDRQSGSIKVHLFPHL
jgi:threonine dehydrogenase-like Zn-dependent dehydrogenase